MADGKVRVFEDRTLIVFDVCFLPRCGVCWAARSWPGDLEGRSSPTAAHVDRPDDMPAPTGRLAGPGAIALTPDSRHVVAGDAEVVRLWRADTWLEAAAWVGHGALH